MQLHPFLLSASLALIHRVIATPQAPTSMFHLYHLPALSPIPLPQTDFSQNTLPATPSATLQASPRYQATTPKPSSNNQARISNAVSICAKRILRARVLRSIRGIRSVYSLTWWCRRRSWRIIRRVISSIMICRAMLSEQGRVKLMRGKGSGIGLGV
jgi:hypothetical protein